MAEPSLENGENGETPSKKVRRRVGTSPDFMQLAQKRKGKPEVKKSTRSRFFSTPPLPLQPIFVAFPATTSLWLF